MDRYQSDTVEHYFTASFDDQHKPKPAPKHVSSWKHILRNEIEWQVLFQLAAAHLFAFWGTYRILVYGFTSYKTLLLSYTLGK